MTSNATSSALATVTLGHGVAEIALDAHPVNALSDRLIAEIDRMIDPIAQQMDCQVLLIRSRQRVFCAGSDLREMEARFQANDGGSQSYAYVGRLQSLFAKIETLPQITIAEIAGAALGGGFELALACDLRIAAHEAKLGLPEVSLGLIPGAGGTQRLARLVGRGLASRLVFGAEIVDGASAEALGLIQWACPRSEIEIRARDLARRLGALPRAALLAAKACLRVAPEPGRGGFLDEMEATRRLQSDPETRRLVGAFLERGRL